MSSEGENSNRNQEAPTLHFKKEEAPTQASGTEQEAKLGEHTGTEEGGHGGRVWNWEGGDEIGLIGRGRRKAGER